MSFEPFNHEDFHLLGSAHGGLPPQLENKINALRQALGEFPEFQLESFRSRIVRRPRMRGKNGLVFGRAKIWTREDVLHWYFYVVNGDQDEVQLNIGMGPTYVKVGLGFQMGRQVDLKIPAFRMFQTFLGTRPPLPFREAFRCCVERNGFTVEDHLEWKTPDDVLHGLETLVIPADQDTQHVFMGKLWTVEEAIQKTAGEYRRVFHELLPFYEALILMGGRFQYCEAT